MPAWQVRIFLDLQVLLLRCPSPEVLCWWQYQHENHPYFLVTSLSKIYTQYRNESVSSIDQNIWNIQVTQIFEACD